MERVSDFAALINFMIEFCKMVRIMNYKEHAQEGTMFVANV